MFENLLQLVKENASEAIINNPAIPNDRNDEAISLASNGIFEGLKDKLSNGGLQDIFSNSNPAQSGATNQIAGNVAGQLMEKFGLDNGAAKGIVEKLIPVVMEKFVNKTNDPNDNSFDLGDIMKNLGGSGGIGGMLGGLFGK